MRTGASRLVLAGVIAFALCASVLQAADVRVMGLFDGRALLSIDGKQRFLKAGETTPEGIKLIQADTDKAILEIAGKRDEYRIGSDIHTGFSAPKTVRVQIAKDQYGMFTTAGAINGIPVSFMVDTGASSVAMNAAVAGRLGIAFRHSGKPITVATAGGQASGWRIVLRSVRVGEIERTNVEAVVVEAKTNHDILLGMSFLGTVKMEKQSNLLVLEAQY